MVVRTFQRYCLSVGLSVCLLVCLLEPLHFLWKLLNLGERWAVLTVDVLEFVLECLFGGGALLGFVLELLE